MSCCYNDRIVVRMTKFTRVVLFPKFIKSHRCTRRIQLSYCWHISDNSLLSIGPYFRPNTPANINVFLLCQVTIQTVNLCRFISQNRWCITSQCNRSSTTNSRISMKQSNSVIYILINPGVILSHEINCILCKALGLVRVLEKTVRWKVSFGEMVEAHLFW